MRQIYTISAKQCVVSQSHPEGIVSDVSGYPVSVDSRSYNNSTDIALIVAQSEYAKAVKDLTLANNPNRAMWTVTLEQADGRQLARKSFGAFPVEPEPNEEPAE